MRHTVETDSVNTTHFGCYYWKVRYTDLWNFSQSVSWKRQQTMATYSLFLGILVIIISWKFYNDWASGLAGFFYGGILFWSIKLFVQLIKTLFG